MPIPLGVLAVAGAGVAPVPAGNAYEWLETVIVPATPQASVEFTNLGTNYSSTYQHLQIRMATFSSVDTWFRVQLNGATTNYYSHRLVGESGAVTSAASASSSTGMQLIGLTGSSSVPGSSIIDILDPFETSKNTTIRCLTRGPNTIALTSGLWNDTSSLTSIKLNNDGGNFNQYTRVSLYGMRSS
jgi:hypothetical protein